MTWNDPALVEVVPRLFVGETAWQLTCIRIWHQGDYNSTCASHEYWIMHVIFDRSYVTVCNVQLVVVASKIPCSLYWTVAILSSGTDAPLVVDVL